MSRRNYPVADLYEERERDFYHDRPRRPVRDYEELDADIRRGSLPDFLRDDYGRSEAGPLVRRSRTVVDDHDTRSNASPRRPREVVREEIDIHEKEVERARSERPRSHFEDDVISRRDDRPRTRPREYQRDDGSVRSERPRRFERDDFSAHRSDRSRPHVAERDEEIDIRVSDRESRPPPARSTIDKEEITIRRDEEDVRSRKSGRTYHVGGRSNSRDRVTIRSRSRSRPRPAGDLVARETEEFVIRRRRPPSPSSSSSSCASPPPPRERERIKEEIIIRRTEREPTPPPREPTPEPEPEPEPVCEPVKLPPIIRPPIHQEIHQEIITHHRHIDYGVQRYRSPSPIPAPCLPPPSRECTPTPPKIETLEIDINRNENGHITQKNITIERKEKGGDRSCSPSPTRSRSRSRVREQDLQISTRPRTRSLGAASSRGLDDRYDHGVAEEADYYNRRALRRGHPGEAQHGATRDWGLVDIPPGTERVRMDGAGGGAQEITWQRYDGDRRSKFYTGDREYDTGFGGEERRRGSTRRRDDMWTEVTKDLVSREACEAMGYQYEETDRHFYVMEYLKYEDVLQLVELSDEIRYDRTRRVREVEWQRSGFRRRSGRVDSGGFDSELVIERERRR